MSSPSIAPRKAALAGAIRKSGLFAHSISSPDAPIDNFGAPNTGSLRRNSRFPETIGRDSARSRLPPAGRGHFCPNLTWKYLGTGNLKRELRRANAVIYASFSGSGAAVSAGVSPVLPPDGARARRFPRFTFIPFSAPRIRCHPMYVDRGRVSRR
jgi:hypothetical protein